MARFIEAHSNGETHLINLDHIVSFTRNQAGNYNIETDNGELHVVLIDKTKEKRKDLLSQIYTL
jgi:hypothetical protein